MGAWIIRAGRGGVYAANWLQRGIVGIGWDLGGADISAMTREQIRGAYSAAHPSESKGRVSANVGQIYRFAHEVAPGEAVVMYDPSTRLYHIGEVAGPCVAVDGEDGLAYSRAVSWGGTAPRDALFTPSKNSLGGIQTLFAVSPQVMADLEGAAARPADLQPEAVPEYDGDADDGPVADAVSYSAPEDGLEAIKDRIVGEVQWDEMERLVAGLLRAMGYFANLTGPGVDGGRDVVASRDALGLDSPCVVTEVKHRKGAMGAPAIRSFIAGLHGNERGMYVSTGGFSKDAHVEAMHASKPVRLVDLDEFVRLYVENYASMDEETRKILPLTCIWCPA